MGKRIDLSTLATEPVVAAAAPASLADGPLRLRQVPVSTVAPNPINPRERIGDLSDLESMKVVGQLQPCVVVTRTAFTTVYPEHANQLGAVDFVVVAGSRRRLAAEQFGLPTLDIVVRDLLAANRGTLYAAAISENIDRQQLDVLEEARAVDQLVTECGTAIQAAEILGRTKGWVSQRRALLRLSPTMQDLLRSGELSIRDARRLAALPAEEQEPTWHEEQKLGATTPPPPPPAAPKEADGHTTEATDPETAREPAPQPIRIPRDASPADVAATLRQHYNRRQLKTLARLLAED